VEADSLFEEQGAQMSQGERYITVTLVIQPADGKYASHCVELGTASCGDTVEEAVANIKEAVLVDLSALEQIGERARFFRERGIKMKSRRPARQVPVRRKVYRDAFTTVEDVPVPVAG